MDQRNRTSRALVCLVGAMTGTAVFVGWIDPSLPAATDAPTAGKIARLAQLAVTGGVTIEADQWYNVEVVPSAPYMSSAPLLAANLNRGDRHFVVAPDGRPAGTNRWRRQQPLSDAPHTVRIEVNEAVANQAMTPAQRLCVESLIAALGAHITLDGPPLPVRVRGRP